MIWLLREGYKYPEHSSYLKRLAMLGTGDLFRLKGWFLAPFPLVAGRFYLPFVKVFLMNGWPRWRAAPEVAVAQAAFPAVGRNYFLPKPRDRSTFSMFLRFLTSDVFLGTLHLPRDDWYDSMCPICGDELSRAHILLTCPGLAVERAVLTRQASMDQLSDWNWIVRKGEIPMSRFLVLVQRRFADAGSLGVRSSELFDLSSRVGLDVLGDWWFGIGYGSVYIIVTLCTPDMGVVALRSWLLVLVNIETVT